MFTSCDLYGAYFCKHGLDSHETFMLCLHLVFTCEYKKLVVNMNVVVWLFVCWEKKICKDLMKLGNILTNGTTNTD